MKKGLLIFLFLISLFTTFSQTIEISGTIPECDYQIIGTWNNKIISCKRFFERKLTIVDTVTLEKQTVKVGPKIGKVTKMGSIRYFIHADFLYEFYFVIKKYAGDYNSPIGYNVVVKRDLKTLEIVTQKRLFGLFGQMKFVKPCDDGFFFCLGTSHTPINQNLNFIYESPSDEIIPETVQSFNYNLEELWSSSFSRIQGAKDEYFNDMSFDEDSYLLIPSFHESFIEGEDTKNGSKILFQVANLQGEVAKIKLDLDDLDAYVVNSLKIKYDPENKKLFGMLMVAKPIENDPYLMSEWGYIYASWREDGSLIASNLTLIDKEDILGANIGEYAHRINFDLNTVTKFDLDSKTGYFDVLKDGSALYIANNICLRIEERLVHSKFILSVSKAGKLNWSLTLPYNGNQLYEIVNYVVHEGQLYMYTREFRQNFESGSYIFEDTREGLTRKSLLMSQRIIDLKTGEIISHKPLIEYNYLSKFVPSFRVYADNPNELMIRYRNTPKNLEKLVRIKFE